MKNKLVVVPTIIDPIKRSPGFAKKLLATWKLDLLALCAFGCRYCSSNTGNYLRIMRERFAALTEQQLGERTLPADDPALMFVWNDIIERLGQQLARKSRDWGGGETLVFSMLTDGFSPPLVQSGTTLAALELLLARTSFRIRVLTKNAVVGSHQWVEFFLRHRERFVVGLSVGTLDNEWAKAIEIGTSQPSARLRAMRNLQEAGVPTFGMLCPIFPDVLAGGQLEALIDSINPNMVEHIWAEPYNDRVNWRSVRDGYASDSYGHEWLTRVYECGDRGEWSRYSAELYARLAEKARRGSWLSKLRYLQYEHGILAKHVRHFGELEGVLLQSPTDDAGLSRHPEFAAIQQRLRG